VLADQPFWARRLHALGVAPRPVPLPRLDAETLAAAIRTVMTTPSYADRARTMARRLSTEDGAARVAQWIRARE
jgi:sterol 3beta-glucosyltransferase